MDYMRERVNMRQVERELELGVGKGMGSLGWGPWGQGIGREEHRA
jgi:hypothetical protein